MTHWGACFILIDSRWLTLGLWNATVLFPKEVFVCLKRVKLVWRTRCNTLGYLRHQLCFNYAMVVRVIIPVFSLLCSATMLLLVFLFLMLLSSLLVTLHLLWSSWLHCSPWKYHWLQLKLVSWLLLAFYFPDYNQGAGWEMPLWLCVL